MLNSHRNNASGEEDDEDEKEGSIVIKTTPEMHVNEDSQDAKQPSKRFDLNNHHLDTNGELDISEKTEADIEPEIAESDKKLTVKLTDTDKSEDKMSVGDLEPENKSDGEVVDEEKEENLKSEGKENCDSVIHVKELSDSEIELEVKRTLREAVEIRVPKMKSRKDSKEQKWLGSLNSQMKSERPETPPLQKLMRQDFSPLKANHSPPKRMKESPSLKDGFTSKLASVIVPSTSIPLRTASHPKQLLSHAFASLRNQSISHKSSNFLKSAYSASSLLSPSFSPLKSTFQPQNVQDDQPLDLSKKSGKESKDSSSGVNSRNGSSNSKKSSQHKSDYSFSHDNGISSTSLKSLQQKFGGDFHLRGLRKPTNYMLFGPEIPALQQALLHSASLSLPHFPLSMSNGVPKLKSEHSPSYKHRNSTPSPNHKIKSEDIGKPVKKDTAMAEKASKRERFEKADSSDETEPVHEEHNEKYTNHMCTCGKWYDSLYSLSLHLQETGHLPARSKSVSLLEYPKLVRGQDMWLNQESEQTRRILRCIQCGESFKTLPMLTVHMMKTQHYTKIVSSEHARRAHKCSAYCDKEQDKECVFKCKVCHDSFSDMEGLANHMIMSGHHKKQVPRPPPQSFNDIQFRQKRKRLYSFEDNVNPYNSAMAAMMEFKQKNLPGRSSPEENGEGDVEDNLINCENCGKKIEMKFFVEHVRACLGLTLAADIKKYKEMKEREVERKLEQGSKRKRHGSLGMENEDSENKKQREETNGSAEDAKEDKVKDTKQEVDIKKEVKDEYESKSNEIKGKLKENEESAQERLNGEQLKESVEEDSVKAESPRSEIHSPSNQVSVKLETSNSPNSKGKRGVKNGHEEEDIKARKKNVAKNLNIIDPDISKEETQSSGSALSAMESFIKKSFSNKFDYKKGNIIIGATSLLEPSIHSRPLASAMTMDSIDYLNKYKKFYSALNLQNGLKQDSYESAGGKKYYEKGLKSKREDEHLRNSESPLANGSESQENGRSSVKSYTSDNSSSLDTNENIEKKYLNMTEESDEKTEKGKSSALDNLSSFVYGQPMTSEHPLDSLQRLITKADIPKLMAGHGGRAFKYLPPHLQLHGTHADSSTIPLNLSLKTLAGHGGENDSEVGDEDEDKFRADEDSLSDYEAACSPANSDGEPVEYRCAACSRRFASKGSYRYHLSRCHLSSVKRYGIKEAFNMSPYVYLPLDHTAKFSKYYEMAKELANRRK